MESRKQPLTWSDETLDSCIESLANDTPIAHFPIPELNEAMGGVHKGRLTVVAGPPGSGKTSLMNMLKTNLAMQGIPVLYAFYEMAERSLIAKSVSYLSHETVKVSNFPDYIGTPELETAVERYREIAPLVCHYDAIEDGGNILDAMDRACIEKGAPCVLIVDYLQLMPMRDRALQTEERTQVKNAMADLRHVAMKLECPVFAVSAINRTNYNKPDAGLDAMAESSAIEYGADMVMNLVVPGNSKERAENLKKAVRPVDASILKSRYGSCDVVELEFVTEYAFFRKR